MWEKVAEFLVVASAFFLAPFVTPEPPVVIEQPPVVIEEQQLQPEEKVLPVETAPESKPTEPVVEATPVKVVDPYCAQYAFRYSAEKYKSETERPDEVRKDCYKRNKSKEGDSITELSEEDMDCPDKIKKAEKELKAWKKKYDEYQVRCP
jgi:hypothetical protein